MKKKILMPITIIAVILATVLAIVYVSFYSYYQSHFMPGTTINGINCSGKTESKALDALNEAVEDYVLRIKEGEKTEFITGSRISLALEYDTDISGLLEEQGAALWFVNAFQTREFTIASTVTYNEESLIAAMNKLNCMNPDTIVEPVNAYIDAVDGEYVIVPEEEGNEVDSEKLLEILKEAVENLTETVNLSECGVYRQAEVTSDDEKLLAELASYQEYEGVELTIAFGDAKETIGAPDIISWLVENEDGSLTLSEDLVSEYVKKLATDYNTFGTGLPRTFTTQAGVTRSIYGGDYGWWMNQSETAAAIIAAIEAKESGQVEPVWRQTAYSFGDNDYGNSYCEVDISKQHVWVVIDGEVVMETDCVTGKSSNGHDTPTGCYGIRFLRTNYTLVGQDYNSKVSFWMPFYDDVGFHDATWRSSFGGTIYKNNGSHGCVNLPYDAAAQMYELVYVGMPVFVYESE